MNEADTCRTTILPKLKNSGWEDDAITEQYVLTPGRIVPVGSQHTRKAGLRPDYVLFIRQNIQIAVMEAKADYANAADGLAQAMRYAEMLGVKFAYANNGKKIIEHDFITGLERDLSEFPTPDELWGRLQGTLNLPTQQDKTDALTAYSEQVGGKTPRYYQMIAINRVVNAVLGGQKRILLTMATGTGKTFVAFQIAWRLWKSGRKKRILFLADRNVLIDQAKDRTFVPMGQALHKLQGKVSALRTAHLEKYDKTIDNTTAGWWAEYELSLGKLFCHSFPK